jgi:hypothetical protein
LFIGVASREFEVVLVCMGETFVNKSEIFLVKVARTSGCNVEDQLLGRAAATTA